MNGTLVRERRQALGLSQEALARQLRVTLRTVQRWEQGSNWPMPGQLRGLARAFGLRQAALKRMLADDQDKSQGAA